MKRLALIQVCILISVFSFSQEIKMTTKNVHSNDLSDLLDFEDIQHYKISFIGDSLIGKDYLIVSKELWNGVITKVDTILDSSKNDRLLKIDSNSFGFNVWSKKTEDNFLKVKFDFPRVHLRRKYRAIDTDDYSLRDYGIFMDIKAGKKFYALAYILPYEKDGWKFYCGVEESDVEIEEWGSHFNIEHYIIYEMLFH